MTRDQMLAYLHAANAVARDVADHGHHPFGAVLSYGQKAIEVAGPFPDIAESLLAPHRNFWRS